MIQLFSNEFKVKSDYLGDFKYFIINCNLSFDYNPTKDTYWIYGTSEGYQTLYNLDTQLYSIEFNEEEIDLYTDEENEDYLKATVSFTWFLSQVVDSLAIYYEFDTETQRIIATRINDNNCNSVNLDILMNMYEN